jgi:hypothetical protein
MITNNMLLKLKTRDNETITKARDMLLSMKGKIEYLRDISVFTNIRPGGAAYDLAVIGNYDSLQDFDAYLNHPVHLDVSKYIGTVVDSVAAVCHES